MTIVALAIGSLAVDSTSAVAAKKPSQCGLRRQTMAEDDGNPLVAACRPLVMYCKFRRLFLNGSVATEFQNVSNQRLPNSFPMQSMC